jgi:catechol 2,3-dioxygenase-like lactoylglutathione lyase family enzyme
MGQHRLARTRAWLGQVASVCRCSRQPEVGVIGSLKTVVFDAPDHRALAAFYAELLGGEHLDDAEDWTTVRTADGWRLGFQLAPDLRRSTWPSQELPQQLHLDLFVPDLSLAVQRAESLGATPTAGGGETFVVLTDPAGHPFCLCVHQQDEPIGVFGVALDCPDPAELAHFYAALLGMQIAQLAEDGAWLTGEGPMANVTISRVTDYNPPRWPDPAAPQQLHLDVLVEDADTAEQRALAIGATRLPGEGENWRVYADPAGHPFCLVYEMA